MVNASSRRLAYQGGCRKAQGDTRAPLTLKKSQRLKVAWLIIH